MKQIIETIKQELLKQLPKDYVITLSDISFEKYNAIRVNVSNKENDQFVFLIMGYDKPRARFKYKDLSDWIVRKTENKDCTLKNQVVVK